MKTCRSKFAILSLALYTCLASAGSAPRAQPVQRTPPSMTLAERVPTVEQRVQARLVQVLAYWTRHAGHFDDLEAIYLSAAELDPGDYVSRSALAQLAYERGDRASAVEWLHASHGCQSAHSIVFDSLATYRNSLGALSAAIEADPNDLYARLRRAEVWLVDGRVDDAAEEFRIALRVSHDDPVALHLLSFALQETGRHEEARQVAQRLVDVHPRFGRAELTLAYIQIALDDHHGATESLRRFLTILPSDDVEGRGEALRALGWCRFLAGDIDGAATIYEQATCDGWVCPRLSDALEEEWLQVARMQMRLNPNNHFARFVCAYKDAFEFGQEQRSISELQACTDQTPDRGLYHAGLSQVLYNAALARAGTPLGQDYATRATFHARRATALMPNSATAWESLAASLHDTGDYPAIVAAGLRAFRTNGAVRPSLFYVATSLDRLGYYEDAASVLSVFCLLGRDVNDSTSHHVWYAAHYSKTAAEFEEYCRYYLRQDGQSLVFRHLLGNAFARLGDKQRATVEYRQCVRQHPSFVISLHNIAIRQLMSGEIEAGLKSLHEAIEASKQLDLSGVCQRRL